MVRNIFREYAHCGILNIIEGKLDRAWYAEVKD